MKSMTGFGRSNHRSGQLEIDLSLKSVNGRFLELRFHMPREYAAFESDLKKLVTKKISRGTVDVYINRRLGIATEAVDVQVRSTLAKKWLKAYKTLAKDLKLKQQPNLEMIARVPDVLAIDERTEVQDEERELVTDLLKKAVDMCDQERLREGKSLQTELKRLLGQLADKVKFMESAREAANQELERKFRERLDRLGIEGQIEPQRLAQEVVMQIDKTDIAEEMQRLKEHLKAYNELVDDKESHGKKMDFYAQELLREVNTVGSKSHVTALTTAVIDSKSIVERIREQVQNAE
jgi:uncharacterized protein (TIGR00255 family)